MADQDKIETYFSSQRPHFSMSDQIWNPPTDVFETEEATIVKMEVAGLDEAELKITVESNRLIIQGQRRNTHCQQKINYHLMEVHYSSFRRAIAFSHKLDPERVETTYDRGFLIIEIPRQ